MVPALVAPRVSIPRLPDPTPIVPTHNWYSVIPLPAVQVNVVEDPYNTLPGAGLVMPAFVLLPEPPLPLPPLPLPPLPLPPLLPPVPVPLRPIVAVLPEEALLLIVSVPVTPPAAAGSKPTESVTDCPGFSVTGNVAPERVKPAPLTDAALIVRAPVPDETSVTDCGLAAVFTATEPKARPLVLKVSDGVAVTLALSRRVYGLETPDAVAVIVAVWLELTAATFAVKLALVAFAGIVTAAGTVTAGLSLLTVTTCAVLLDAVSVTVHESVPAPVKD